MSDVFRIGSRKIREVVETADCSTFAYVILAAANKSPCVAATEKIDVVYYCHPRYFFETTAKIVFAETYVFADFLNRNWFGKVSV